MLCLKGTYLFASLFLLAYSAMVAAADVSPADEYEKRLKLARTIQPLGDKPFGETVSMLSGELGFQVTDITLEGNGPVINLTRTAIMRERDRGTDPPMLGSWDLSIPRIETMVKTPSRFGDPGLPGENWRVGSSYARCSQIDDLGANNWWNGYEFVQESGQRRNLLKRDAAFTRLPSMQIAGTPVQFPAVMSGEWQVGCLPQTSNGQAGEAFLVVAPDGTKYFLDYLVGQRADTVVEFGPQITPGLAETALGTASGDGAAPMVGPVRIFYPRMFATMFASRVEDRYGNWVKYHYTDNKITAISASDGRAVQINWRPDAPVISSIVVQPGPAQRVWSYNYGPIAVSYEFWGASLASVTLPDGTAWEFLSHVPAGALLPQPGCYVRQASAENAAAGMITMKHPSGLLGSFSLKKKWYARSYVPSNCLEDDAGVFQIEGVPIVNTGDALTSKTFSGPGLTPMTWSYTYSPALGSAMRDPCASAGTCADSRWVDVVDPAGARVRYTVSTRWGVSEGRTIGVDTYSSAGQLLDRTTTVYASPTQGPYAARIGRWMGHQWSTSTEGDERYAPLQKQTTVRDGRLFEMNVEAFDTFGRPIQVRRESSPSP